MWRLRTKTQKLQLPKVKRKLPTPSLSFRKECLLYIKTEGSQQCVRRCKRSLESIDPQNCSNTNRVNHTIGLSAQQRNRIDYLQKSLARQTIKKTRNRKLQTIHRPSQQYAKKMSIFSKKMAIIDDLSYNSISLPQTYRRKTIQSRDYTRLKRQIDGLEMEDTMTASEVSKLRQDIMEVTYILNKHDKKKKRVQFRPTKLDRQAPLMSI